MGDEHPSASKRRRVEKERPLPSPAFFFIRKSRESKDMLFPKVFWVPLGPPIGCAAAGLLSHGARVGISELPGKRHGGRAAIAVADMEEDLDQILEAQRITDIVSLCSDRDYRRYISAATFQNLLSSRNIQGHFFGIPDGHPPELQIVLKLHALMDHLLSQGRSVVICSTRGLGRAPTVLATYLLYHKPDMGADEAINYIRKARGHAAVQTVKQYNFCCDFREHILRERGCATSAPP